MGQFCNRVKRGARQACRHACKLTFCIFFFLYLFWFFFYGTCFQYEVVDEESLSTHCCHRGPFALQRNTCTCLPVPTCSLLPLVQLQSGTGKVSVRNAEIKPWLVWTLHCRFVSELRAYSTQIPCGLHTCLFVYRILVRICLFVADQSVVSVYLSVCPPVLNV